jgi:hypothetical protein
MSSAPRELRELALLLRIPEPGSNNIGLHVAADAEVLAPLLRTSPSHLRSLAPLRDDDLAPRLVHRVDAAVRGASERDLDRRAARASEGARLLGATARWTEYGAVLDVDVLLRDVIADRGKKYIAFSGGEGIGVTVRREMLGRVATLRRLHIDLVAFVDRDGLHFRWKGGRGGYDWKPQTVHPADAHRVLTVRLHPARVATRSDRGAWLGDILRELGFPA